MVWDTYFALFIQLPKKMSYFRVFIKFYKLQKFYLFLKIKIWDKKEKNKKSRIF